MNDPATLQDMIALAEQTFDSALSERTHPARYISFCTISPDGPAARTVMLRRWDAPGALVQTDAASAKVGELAADNRAALLLWDPRTDVQLRLSTRVTVETGDESAWAPMPAPARLNYGGHPPPGHPMRSAEEYVPGTDVQRLAILHCQTERLEVLHLGRNMHRRASFAWGDAGWDGGWVAP